MSKWIIKVVHHCHQVRTQFGIRHNPEEGEPDDMVEGYSPDEIPDEVPEAEVAADEAGRPPDLPGEEEDRERGDEMRTREKLKSKEKEHRFAKRRLVP